MPNDANRFRARHHERPLHSTHHLDTSPLRGEGYGPGLDHEWFTIIAPVVNPLTAACHNGYVPTDIYVLNTPIIDEPTDAATSLMKTVVTAHDGAELAITVETIDDETDFEAISAYLQSALVAGADAEADIAVDITPGRRFWSVISFQTGIKHDADHPRSK